MFPMRWPWPSHKLPAFIAQGSACSASPISAHSLLPFFCFADSGAGQSGADHLHRQGRHTGRNGGLRRRAGGRPGADLDGGGGRCRAAGLYPAAFHAVQWLGAAYLGWLGFRMLTARPGDKPVLHIEPRHYFRQAGLITLMNPKSIVFYMAFFPLFVDPASHQGLLTFAVMAATVAVLTFLLPDRGAADRASGRAHARQSCGFPGSRKDCGRVSDRFWPQAGHRQISV